MKEPEDERVEDAKFTAEVMSKIKKAHWKYDRASGMLVSNLEVGMLKFDKVGEILEEKTGLNVRYLETATRKNEIGISHGQDGLVLSGDIIAAAEALGISFRGKSKIEANSAKGKVKDTKGKWSL